MDLAANRQFDRMNIMPVTTSQASLEIVVVVFCFLLFFCPNLWHLPATFNPDYQLVVAIL